MFRMVSARTAAEKSDNWKTRTLWGVLSVCVVALISTDANAYQLRSKILEREAIRNIDLMEAEGFVFESVGDDDISVRTALTIQHAFQAGHKHVVVAYVENCPSCDLKMEFVPTGSSQSKFLDLEIERAGQHTRGMVSIRPDTSVTGKIDVFVESSVPRYAVVLFFTRPY